MNVMGQKRSDDEILEIVKKFSDDKKNNSLELNEFIKMIAVDVKRDATGNQEELLDAFRWGDEVTIKDTGCSQKKYLNKVFIKNRWDKMREKWQ